MFYQWVLFFTVLCSCLWIGIARKSYHKEDSGETDLGLGLITSLRDDANLDLSVDEEYEDLRAELLAYQAALASVISRRSLMSTPCWQAGGICVNYKLCKGANKVSQVAGCRDKSNVCCFAWNRYYVRDYRDKGIPNIALPWKTMPQDFGGEGIKEPKHTLRNGRKKKPKKKNSKSKTMNNLPPIRAIIPVI